MLEPLLPQVAERQRAVLESGRYVLGPELEMFEREFAAYVGRRHCVGVANGTEALTIVLRGLGIEPGDEVIVPAFTFFATAEAVVNAGARPTFADIDLDTNCITAKTVEGLIGPRTRAILPVHLFGNPAPIGELSELASSRGLLVVEDAAQAAGARLEGRRAGALGDAACFSFYPGKPLGAFGDAGALLTEDDEVAAAARGFATMARPRGGSTPRSASIPASTSSRPPRFASSFPTSMSGPQRGGGWRRCTPRPARRARRPAARDARGRAGVSPVRDQDA